MTTSRLRIHTPTLVNEAEQLIPFGDGCCIFFWTKERLFAYQHPTHGPLLIKRPWGYVMREIMPKGTTPEQVCQALCNEMPPGSTARRLSENSARGTVCYLFKEDVHAQKSDTTNTRTPRTKATRRRCHPRGAHERWGVT
jgi:hypothetical protein